MITFTIPLKTENPLNGSQGVNRNWAMRRARRRKKERNTARLCTLAAIPSGWLLLHAMGIVTLTRLSAGRLDGDGLQAATKSVRDGVADALEVNDGSEAVTWKYGQRKCRRGAYGVEVSIE